MRHECASSRAIAVVTVGQRPWTKLTVPRMAHLASRLRADLVMLSSSPSCGASPAVGDCAKRDKLLLARELLGGYHRVLLLDDTVLVRR